MSSFRVDYPEETEFLRKVDGVLLGRQILLTTENIGLGYADMQKGIININMKELARLSKDYDEFLIMNKGVDYHELGHFFYSKKIIRLIRQKYYEKYQNRQYGGGYAINMRRDQVLQLCNVVEDGRVETLNSIKYPKMAVYFKYNLIKHIIEKCDDLSSINHFMLVWSRRAFIEKKLIPENNHQNITLIKELIDKYVVETDSEKHYAILEALYDALQMTTNEQVQSNSDSKSLEHSNRSSTTKQEAQLSQDAKQKLDDADDDEESESDDDEDVEDDESGDGEAGDGDDIDSDAKPSLHKALSDIKEDLKDDLEQQKEIMGKHDFYEDDEGAGGSYWSPYASKIFRPMPQHYQKARQLEREMNVLKNELSSRIIPNLKRGTLSVRSAMSNESRNSFNDFKRFIPSAMDKSRMAVDIYVDASSSMEDEQYNIAVGSAWSIAKSIESLKGVCRISEFSGAIKLQKSEKHKIDHVNLQRTQRSHTDICSGLDGSKKFMDSMKHRYLNRIVMIITDGAFDNDSLAARQIRELETAGNMVVIFQVKYPSIHPELASYVVKVDDFSGLERSMSKAMLRLQRKAIKDNRGV